MIKLNLPVLFAQRGIRVADADRMSKLGRSTLYRMYNNEVTRIDFDSLNELCKLLDCTPGDIILYEEDEVCGIIRWHFDKLGYKIEEKVKDNYNEFFITW